MKKITAINQAIQKAISVVEARKKKKLEEPDYNAAAQYGLIQEGSPVSLFCTTPMMELAVSDSTPFARFLINFMKWQTGRPFVLTDYPDANDEWSRIINHLIWHTLTKHFNRRNIKMEDEPRTSKDLLKMLVSDDVKGDDEAKNPESENDEGDISILYIEKDWKKEWMGDDEPGIDMRCS